MNNNISLFYKVYSAIKTFFWNNPNIIYINSNKKKQNKMIIDELVPTRGYKWVVCESNTKLGYRFYNIHLLKMKKNLYDISRNLSDSNSLIYSGFVSPMFAAYDGFCLGDNRDYTFVDIDSNNSNGYKINYKKNIIKVNEIKEIKDKTINIIYSSSRDINIKGIDKSGTFYFYEKSGNKVKPNYLQKVYSYTKQLLDICSSNGVEQINMYIAAKQPVSFIIGTAIRSGHPKVYIHEYFEGNYVLSLLVQEGRIIGKNGK